jgi:AcrR family transcriptional regulator
MGIRETKRIARRTAIEDAGLRLFLDDGYDRASVERIAAAVGIARGTFYLYYEDKQALFNALCERLYSPIVSALDTTAEALRNAASPQEQQLLFLQMAANLAGLAPTLRPLLMLHFREAHSAGPSGEVVGLWTSRLQERAETILTDARGRGLIRDHDVRTVALAIIGAVERLTWAWLNDESRVYRDTVALELSTVFFRGIHPDES